MIKGLALITGGSSGLGLEYARQLAAGGCDLILVSNKEEELENAGAQIRSEFPVRVTTHYQDLALDGAADELFAWCREKGFEVEILVSNAGVFFYGELGEKTYKKSKAMLRLHVETPTRLIILFGEDMKRRGHGTIISMSSLAADLPFPGITLYSSTKAYLKAFGRAMVHELRPYGVSLTTVCPGGIATSLYGLRDDLMKFAVGIGVIKTPKWLVRKVLRRAGRRRPFVRPGLPDALMIPLLRLLPSHLETRIWVRFRR